MCDGYKINCLVSEKKKYFNKNNNFKTTEFIRSQAVIRKLFSGLNRKR